MSREDEARRDLERLSEQSEKMLGAPPVAGEAEDRIEALGIRIARIITYALAAYLIYWLYAQLA